MNSFLWNRVLRYVGKRERSEKEIRDYIKRIETRKTVGVDLRVDPHADSPGGLSLQNNINEIIEKLKNLDLINEERFAKAYIHDAYELQHKGKNRIKYELTNKRISKLTIDKYLNEIGKDDEEKKALELAEKKYEFMKNLPQKTIRRRLFGQLVRRGFSPQIVSETIDIILKKR